MTWLNAGVLSAPFGVLRTPIGVLVGFTQTSNVKLISLVLALPYPLFFLCSILVGVPVGILVGSVGESRGDNPLRLV